MSAFVARATFGPALERFVLAISERDTSYAAFLTALYMSLPSCLW